MNLFEIKLRFETDAADVASGAAGPHTLIDTRSPGAFAQAHVPGALNLPSSAMDEQAVAALPDGPLVTYCWGPGCNAATKGAARLLALGRTEVREMIGGIEYWRREGHPVEGAQA